MTKELEKILKEKADKYPKSLCNDAFDMDDAFRAGFRAALTLEVLAKVPEVLALVERVKELGDTCIEHYPSDLEEWADKALKPWQDVEGER
jgi:hypothetical protein